jgi:protein TonB
VTSCGIHLARSLGVLHLDPLEPRTPRLPHQRLGAIAQLAASTALHVGVVLIAASLASMLAPGIDALQPDPTTDLPGQDVRLVFLVSELPPTAGGGGGGGNLRPEPIRRAQGVGSDAITLRTQRRAAAAPVTAAPAPVPNADVPSIPSIVLDAKPLASGFFNQSGLPAGGVSSGPSTGPGSGGGVGTGSGTGIGPGRGPGLGPGSGGGTGGGVYRPGGVVSAPRLMREVRPKYTSEAMTRKIQGTVLLEAIVTRDGWASRIRVVRSLDPGGLDEEAIAAVAQWQFEPGRLGAAPVDVLVMIDVGFWIR